MTANHLVTATIHTASWHTQACRCAQHWSCLWVASGSAAGTASLKPEGPILSWSCPMRCCQRQQQPYWVVHTPQSTPARKSSGADSCSHCGWQGQQPATLPLYDTLDACMR